MFKNRKDAGIKLAGKLKEMNVVPDIVIAIPKGGLEVGYEIAQSMGCKLSVVISRKFPFPNQPESGFGAIAEDGSSYVVPGFADRISNSVLDDVTKKQMEEIKRRRSIFRAGKPFPDIKGKRVVLVDDGIAMGSTMMASISCCKNAGPAQLIVASPVSSRTVASKLNDMADGVLVLESPDNFRAVAQVYEDWYDVSDLEALELLKTAKEKGIYL
ncbi:MAG: phosphoribosyltransferase family protein [Thermoplasmatota archaeon]